MNKNTYLKLSGVIFSVIAALHLLRVVYSWDAVIGGLVITLWASWLAVAVAGFLAYSAFSLYKKS